MKLTHYNGHFYNAETGQRMILAPFLNVEVADNDVLPNPAQPLLIRPAEQQAQEAAEDGTNEYQLILRRGTKIAFDFAWRDYGQQWDTLKDILQYRAGDYGKYNFMREKVTVECVLLEDLYARQTKTGCRFMPCCCEAVSCFPNIPFFEHIQAESLAQLYRRVTDLYIPENGTYNANASATFYISDRDIRKNEPIHPREEKYWHLNSYVERVYDSRIVKRYV
jgi:hypothetical protein